MAEIAECDHCGKKVRLRKDDTVAPHEYTRITYGARWRVTSRARVECKESGKPYARHMGTFRCVGRDRTWVAECRCGQVWTDLDHRVVDQAWAEHAGAKTLREKLAAEAGTR